MLQRCSNGKYLGSGAVGQRQPPRASPSSQTSRANPPGRLHVTLSDGVQEQRKRKARYRLRGNSVISRILGEQLSNDRNKLNRNLHNSMSLIRERRFIFGNRFLFRLLFVMSKHSLHSFRIPTAGKSSLFHGLSPFTLSPTVGRQSFAP